MKNVQYPEIDEVITYIQNHIHDPLSLSALANHISYSPYHFSRIFKERMGVSPLYYVSSVRLQKAKHLLLHTNLSIRDISEEIGQQSLGTFTTRFSEKVGISPSAFRQSSSQASSNLEALHYLYDQSQTIVISQQAAKVEGEVFSEIPFEGIIFIGLFPKPIPEGVPHYGTLITEQQGHYCIPNVEPGIYYVMATTISWGMRAVDILLPGQTLRTRSRKPIKVEAGSVITEHIYLYPPHMDDPPILISLPILMKQFLHRTQQHNV